LIAASSLPLGNIIEAAFAFALAGLVLVTVDETLDPDDVEGRCLDKVTLGLAFFEVPLGFSAGSVT
jgi:hypothetical protein